MRLPLRCTTIRLLAVLTIPALNLLFASVNKLYAVAYYVAKNGSNANTGTAITAPLLTVQAALDKALPGDTLFVRNGTYTEKLVWKTSGLAGQPIVLMNYTAESPVIDGTGTGSGALLTVFNKSYLEVAGIIFRNNYFQEAKGIHVYGEGRNVTIRNCTVRNIGWTTVPDASPFSVSPNGQAHGILINGRTATGYRAVNVINTVLYDLITGNSEALTLVGNIDGFLIDKCSVYNTKNIGIVAAGYYAWAVDAGVPEAVNQARNGQISGCIVYNNRRFSNDYAPAGIYIDGGKNISITGNKSYRNGNGMSVGCETASKETRGIVLMNNAVYDNDNHGIVFGSNQASSRVRASYMINNTVMADGTFGQFRSEITLQNADSCLIVNNIIIPRSNAHYGVSVFGYTTTRLVVNNNLVYRYSGSAADVYVPGSPAQFTPSNTLTANPVFQDTARATLNLGLQKTSPAINAGVSAIPFGTDTDITGGYRTVNGIVDLGAYERQDGGCPAEYVIDAGKVLSGKFVAAQRLIVSTIPALWTAPVILSAPSVSINATLRARNSIKLDQAGCR